MEPVVHTTAKTVQFLHISSDSSVYHLENVQTFSRRIGAVGRLKVGHKVGSVEVVELLARNKYLKRL